AREFANSTSWMGTKISRADLQTIYRGTYGDAAQRQAALKILDAHLDDDWTPTMLLQLEPWSRKARQDSAFPGFAHRIGMLDYWKRYGWPDLCKPAPSAGAEAF